MRSSIITPVHNFKQPSRWYYRVQEVKKYEYVVVTYGITQHKILFPRSYVLSS
jgi:hypothetical protein